MRLLLRYYNKYNAADADPNIILSFAINAKNDKLRLKKSATDECLSWRRCADLIKLKKTHIQIT